MSLVLAYYGDDFTGSTDVMEVLAASGLPTVLFLRPPSPEQLARFPQIRAFGIAGDSRALSPIEMEKVLPVALESLQAAGAPIVHYKICSTFDSSPRIGSIGRAIELGRETFGQHPTPLVVGAPALGRYVVFGNLFARSGLDSEPSRLDRHPTMSRHPVTPMDEADLRVHLACQTGLPVALVDVLQLDQMTAGHEQTSPVIFPLTDRAASPPVVLFDTLCEGHLASIGRELAQNSHDRQAFVVGSSGVEYALVAHWRQTGWIPPSPATGKPGAEPVERIAAVSGSCSPVTLRQIDVARKAGIGVVSLDPRKLLQGERLDDLARQPSILRELKSPRGVILETGSSANDRSAPLSPEERQTVSMALAHLLEELLENSGARRAVVCGGDTSTGVARALGIEALEYAAPMAPGSPLCQVHAPGRQADGCGMVFKGGQVGRDRFFLDVLAGGPEEAGR